MKVKVIIAIIIIVAVAAAGYILLREDQKAAQPEQEVVETVETPEAETEAADGETA